MGIIRNLYIDIPVIEEQVKIANFRSYNTSRIILIFAAFEREYNNFYSSQSIRSERFLDSKDDVLALLTEFEEGKSRKQRKDIKSFKNLISDSGTGLGYCIKNVIEENMEIMKLDKVI